MKEANKPATAAFLMVKIIAKVNEIQIVAEERAVVNLEEVSDICSQKII